MGIPEFERFFRAAAGLDVDKSDLKRYSDFVHDEIYDLLIIGQATAKVSFRLVGAQDPEKIRAAFRAFVLARIPPDAKVEFKSFAGAPASELAFDSPALAKAAKALAS